MATRLYVLLAGGLLAVIGLIGVVAGVSIASDSIVISDVACGNGLGMLDEAPIGSSLGWYTQCEAAVEARQVWAWGLLAVGLIVAVVALAIPNRRTEDSATPPAAA